MYSSNSSSVRVSLNIWICSSVRILLISIGLDAVSFISTWESCTTSIGACSTFNCSTLLVTYTIGCTSVIQNKGFPFSSNSLDGKDFTDVCSIDFTKPE